MRIITPTPFKVYSFYELSTEAKENALTKLYDLNVAHEWWEFMMAYWEKKLESFGFTNVKIYFSGFSSQGDGACFDASICLDTFSNNMVYCAPSYEDARIWRAINLAVYNGLLCNPTIETTNHHYSHENTRTVTLSNVYLEDVPTTDLMLDALGIVEETRYNLCREIYRALETEYDCLTSEEAIIETIEVNEYEFTEDGELY
jgi:hypothetical protein